MSGVWHELSRYPGPLWRPRAAFSLLIVAITLGGIGIAVVVARLFGVSRRGVSKMIRAWCRFCIWICDLKIEVKGALDESDSEQPLLVLCNHQSLIDIPVSYCVTPGNMRMVAKKELSYIPFFGWGMYAAEFIFLERGDAESRRKAAIRIYEKMRGGLRIWIAPEGTRTPNGEIQEFKSGSFAMAIEAQVPIQPLLIVDAFEVMSKHSLWIKPGKTIHVRVLPRIDTAGRLISERRDLAVKVQSEMTAALREERASR